jgi:zinc transport system ATP-binding protein
MQIDPMSDVSLEVFRNGAMVFSSYGRWLHPLFELEEFLALHNLPATELAIRDKVVGRAAALLMVRLELGHVHARVLSRLGEEILTLYEVPHSYDTLVPRIACRTEDLLRDEHDPNAAYTVITALRAANG